MEIVRTYLQPVVAKSQCGIASSTPHFVALPMSIAAPVMDELRELVVDLRALVAFLDSEDHAPAALYADMCASVLLVYVEHERSWDVFCAHHAKTVSVTRARLYPIARNWFVQWFFEPEYRAVDVSREPIAPLRVIAVPLGKAKRAPDAS